MKSKIIFLFLLSTTALTLFGQTEPREYLTENNEMIKIKNEMKSKVDEPFNRLGRSKQCLWKFCKWSPSPQQFNVNPYTRLSEILTHFFLSNHKNGPRPGAAVGVKTIRMKTRF